MRRYHHTTPATTSLHYSDAAATAADKRLTTDMIATVVTARHLVASAYCSSDRHAALRYNRVYTCVQQTQHTTAAPPHGRLYFTVVVTRPQTCCCGVPCRSAPVLTPAVRSSIHAYKFAGTSAATTAAHCPACGRALLRKGETHVDGLPAIARPVRPARAGTMEVLGGLYPQRSNCSPNMKFTV